MCSRNRGGVGAGGATANETKFTMEEGEISDNHAYNSGGGIYINSDDVVLKGGKIENNIAENHGGVIGGIGGGITPPQNVTGSVDSTVPRFDPDDPGERLAGISSSGNYALKAIVSDNTIKLAESQAKL